MRADDLQVTMFGEAMGKATERFAGRFVVLGTVIAMLAGPWHARGETPVDRSPFFEEQPPLPPAPELAPEPGEDQDWSEPADSPLPVESPPEPQGVPAQGTDAPIYPVLSEYCRYSRSMMPPPDLNPAKHCTYSV